MIEETKFPEVSPRRRSSLKRQRLAVLIALGVVVVLAVAFVLVWRFTTRILVEFPNGDNVVDTDGTKYYAVKRNDAWVMINAHGDICERNSEGLYKTKDGTLVMIDQDDGKPTVVATVLLHGTETTMLNANDGSFDILLYPMLERENIQSIEIKNTKDHFTFERQPNGTFALVGYSKAPFSEVMFSTLVVITGYTRTIARLDLSPENPDAEGFRQNGYLEYGLPENPDDAENYFVITSTEGVSHKVIIGDIILDDTGYYARYADRDEVYVLSQMQESEFNSTLSGTLLCAKEDYVTPTVTSTLGEYNYMDVTDFTIYKANGDTIIPDLSAFEKLVQFSFSPIEARKNTYLEHMPYHGEGKLTGYNINDTKADFCLMSLLDMTPGKTVKLYADDGKDSDGQESDANLKDFIKTYGLGFAISFEWNQDRHGADQDYAPKGEPIPHQIWISKMTKTKDGSNVYYMFNETYDMVVMVDRSYVEFLEWNDFKWVEPGIFEANIIYLKDIDIKIKNGTSFGENEENAGKSGITSAFFSSQYVDADGNKANANSNNADIRVFHHYVENGVSSGSNLPFTNTEKFKKFFKTLYLSELYGSMPSDTEELQEQLKATEPDLEITMRFDLGEGKTETKTYRFYRFYTDDTGNQASFVTINGVGSFYMQQNRVEKIIGDVGRLLHDTAQIKNNV